MTLEEENGAPSGAAAAPSRLVIEAGQIGCLILRGEVDAATAWTLAQALDDPDIVALDCTAVSFFDAAGLRVLLQAAATRRLTLRPPSYAVLRVLDITGQAGKFVIEHVAS